MGFGKKADICQNRKGPSPDQYKNKSIFEMSPKKGVTFGLGRDEIKNITFLPKNKTPGPGTYRTFSEFGIYEGRSLSKKWYNPANP